MNEKKKVYLFDFDGTLVDSMPTFGGIIKRVMEESGLEFTDGTLKIVTPLGYRGSAKYFRTLGTCEAEDALTARMEAYAGVAYENTIPAKEGVCETLRALKARGASLNILTASPHVTLDPCLKRIGIWDLFDRVWSCEDFGTVKSNPALYGMVADALGVCVGDVIFVDDNVGAVKTARSAGMIAYGIYDPSSEDYIDEMRTASHRYLLRFDELLED